MRDKQFYAGATTTDNCLKISVQHCSKVLVLKLFA